MQRLGQLMADRRNAALVVGIVALLGVGLAAAGTATGALADPAWRATAPWVVLPVLAVLGLGCRDPWLTAATGLAAAIGAATTAVTAALLPAALPAGLGSLPGVVFVLATPAGTALLTRYRSLADDRSPAAAVADTLRLAGPPVLLGGLATAAALGSLGIAASAPLRVLGASAALGVLVSLGVSLTLVPAVALLGARPGRDRPAPRQPKGWTRAMIQLHLYRPTFAIVLGLMVAAGAGLSVRLVVPLDDWLAPHAGPALLAAVAVTAVLGVGWRDLRLAGIALSPALVTLLVLHGTLGALGLALDPGTSLLSVLFLGLGVTPAAILLSSWVAGPLEPLHHAAGRAAARSQRTVWTQGLALAAGFGGLALGSAWPVPGLAALLTIGALLGALLASVTVPVLGNRKRYLASVPLQDPADPVLDPGVG